MISLFRFRAALFASLWLLGAFLIFVRPWQVPVHGPIVADSYVVGFSNHSALLGLGATLLALFFCHCRFQSPRDQVWDRRFDRLLRPSRRANSRFANREIGFLLAFSLVHCLALWWWFQTVPNTNYGEVGYTVSRLELILLGKIPYRDFEWNYGPFFLYLPLLFIKLSGGKLSSDGAYFWGLLTCTLLGFSGVYYLLKQLRLWNWQRILIFLLLCSTFNLSLGAHGTHLRFVLPFLSLFSVHNQALKISGSKQGRWKLLAQMIVGIWLCFVVSPETGLVFCAGLILFCAMQVRSGQTWYLGALFLALTFGLGVLVLAWGNYLRSIATFGGGASNFPIVPSAQILFFLGSLGFLVPRLWRYGWLSKCPNAALAAGLGVMMTAFAAAALGRCDVGHVFYNGMGLFIFGLALWTRFRPRFHCYTAAFGLFFTLTYPLISLFAYGPAVTGALQKRALGVRKISRRLDTSIPARDPSLRELQSSLLPVLLPLQHVGTPLGAGEDVEMLLKSSGLYICEYFPLPSLEVRTPAQLRRKLGDVQRMPYLIIKTKDLHPKPFDLAVFSSEQQRFVSQVVLYGVSYRVKNRPFEPEREIARFIQLRFTPIANFQSYVIMKNKAAQ